MSSTPIPGQRYSLLELSKTNDWAQSVTDQDSYTFHTDGGHGWLEVSRSEINRLDMGHSISKYSYQSVDGKTIYLEEDCDAPEFALRKGKKKEGYKQVHAPLHPEGSHWIRELPSYQWKS
tara:strand:+ start:3769 stop:4128 length:360 start_codon:yes stop_codon:yes gene_type:complete